jgi:hypothetical protein
MTEQIAEAMVAPDAGGRPALPRRNGPRGLLPSTWLNRSLRVEYTDAWGAGQETSGVLLDFGPTGPILNIRGGRTLLAWDCIRLIELAGD